MMDHLAERKQCYKPIIYKHNHQVAIYVHKTVHSTQFFCVVVLLSIAEFEGLPSWFLMASENWGVSGILYSPQFSLAMRNGGALEVNSMGDGGAEKIGRL